MDNTPLCTLPAELKNTIYELLLCPTEGLHVYVCLPNADKKERPTGPPDLSDVSSDTPSRKLLSTTQRFIPIEVDALTRTCKKIRSDTIGYIYSESTLHFHTFAFDLTNTEFLMKNGYGADRSPPVLIKYQEAWYPCRRTWYNDLAQKTGTTPRRINIDLGTWNMLVKDNTANTAARVATSSLNEHLRSNLPRIAHFFRNKPIECTISVFINHTIAAEARPSRQIGHICLPAGSKQRAMRAVATTVKSKSKALRQEWLHGTLTGHEYSVLQSELQRGRRWLNTFAVDMTKALRDS